MFTKKKQAKPSNVSRCGREGNMNKRLASHTAVMLPKGVCSHHRSPFSNRRLFEIKTLIYVVIIVYFGGNYGGVRQEFSRHFGSIKEAANSAICYMPAKGF